MGYTYCRECGARAEKDNPQCPNCGSSDIGQTYSEMTSEEKKRALAMANDYKKCPGCGKFILKYEFRCEECSEKIQQRWLGPIFDMDQKIKSKLPNWMLEKPEDVEQYFCSDCLARMEVNASSCPECGATLGCKKFSEMSDEEKQWAYKYAKADIIHGILQSVFIIVAVICIMFISFRARFFAVYDFMLPGNFGMNLTILMMANMCGACFLMLVFNLEKLKGLFEKAKGVKKAGIVMMIIANILSLCI